MTTFVAQEYAEFIHALAVGIEPLDALRGGRVAHPVRVDVEGPPPWVPRDSTLPYRRVMGWREPRSVVSRHDSCRHALLYHPSLQDHVDLRIYDNFRRYVPRRLRVPLVTREQADAAPYTHRVRRPVLFPGVAHDVSERTTGLRGRVMRDHRPMRWARVEAHLPDSAVLVGRTHADDRGEFLLMLYPTAAGLAELVDPLPVRVSVAGPVVAPRAAGTDLPEQDALWDLSLEELPPPGEPDPVCAGDIPPAGFASALSASRIVPFPLGRTLSGVEDFDFVA